MNGNPVSRPRQEVSDKLGRTLTDIAVLLEYLGQLSDGRLQAHFEDTRQNIAEVVPRRTSPPCRTYAHFLNRLTMIGVAVRDRMSIDELQALRLPGGAPTPPEHDEGLDNISFLYWSRDFLAGVCGAMIGLFAGYLLKADPTQGLGLSALALLAGYNVSGVFSFMDELSDRMFRPASGAKA